MRVQELSESGVNPAWTAGPGAEGEVIPPFSIGHHKSAARTTTLHLMLSLFMDDEVNVQAAHPMLWQSICEIWCVDVAFKDAKEEAFSNLNRSQAGAIRRAPNVISWVVVLTKLREKGERDTSSIIQAWNNQCTKQGQLVGQKKVSVKNLLELCTDKTRDAIIACVSKHGWENCPFHDSSFSSKKMFPGYAWRPVSGKWAERLRSTAQSVHNCFLLVIAEHDAKPSALRKKLSKEVLEEKALLAAFATSMFNEAVSAGISEAVLKELWLDPWMFQGDVKIEMELSSSLQEKGNAAFTVRDIPTLRVLLDQAAQRSHPSPLLAVDADMVQNQAQALEASTFTLTMKKIEYDCNVWRIYKTNVGQWEHRQHKKAFEWSQKRCEHAVKTVEDVWNARVHLVASDKRKDAHMIFQNVKRGFFSEGMDQEQVVLVGFLNWVAPCMLRGETLESHANQVAFITANSASSICPVLCPQFTYKRGQLYLSEQMMHNMLSRRGVNLKF